MDRPPGGTSLRLRDRRREEVLCLGGITLGVVYSLVMLPIAPKLLGTHPILLEALRGSTPAMVTGGAFARVGEAPLILALLAPLPTIMMLDPLFWWAGRIWGPEAAQWLSGAGGGARSTRLTERSLRIGERYGAWGVALSYFLPVPSPIIFAMTGWTGMSLRRFLVFDAIGASLWIATNVMLGYLIGQGAVDVAKAISRYALYVSLGIVVVYTAYAVWRQRREERAQAAES